MLEGNIAMESSVLSSGPTKTAANGAAVQQEFPAAQPAKLRAEATRLESLVHHREAVNAATSLEQVQREFRARRVEFMAVVREQAVIGLCARGQVGFIMGSRFGFAIYSQHPIETALVDHPLIIVQGTPIRAVLDAALVRTGDDFHEDVVLVDTDRRLIGLIKVETLAQLQSRLVAEQLDELREQGEMLRRQNLELFQANHAVRQTQGLYLGLFASHTLGVALLDREGRIHEHNRRLAELLNFTEGPMVIASLTAWVTEKERPAFLALLDAHAGGAAVQNTHEFTLEVPDRGPRLFRFSTGWIRETGQICACLDDITEQRTIERNLLRQEKQRLLDTLVGGIAHELNNKLTPVQGFAELLGLEASERARGYLEPITRSVSEAARIVRQLLELSKPSVNTTELVDLRTIVEGALVMLRFQLREAHCEVCTVLPADAVWVQADAAQMKQVILNLVINALHAMDKVEKPVLTLEVRSEGATAAFVVGDNGCGIAAENIDRIFDPFFTTKGPERGTGLGLSICFSLVRQHHGEIAVESRPGAGARFTVSLPQEHAPAQMLFAPGEMPQTKDRPGADVPRGVRVLVVEDELVLRRLLQEILSTLFGCRVDVAANGTEALTAIDEYDGYAMVLSDIRMPVMSGTELYLRLRDVRPELSRRFIFVTGHPGDKQLEAEIAQWNVPVIAKPFTLARLSEACGPFLRATETEKRASA